MIRDGVEDTTHKAKDTKRIRGHGQGQFYEGQNLSRPRTGMLGAKNQGNNAEVISKTKKKKIRKFIGKLMRSPKKKRTLLQNFAFSRMKNVFEIFFASSLAFFKTKLNRSWPWPILNKSKPVLFSSRGKDIFEDLRDSRPRPSTLNCDLEARTSSKNPPLINTPSLVILCYILLSCTDF